MGEIVNFLNSVLGVGVVVFYVYMAVAFYRRAVVDHPDWTQKAKVSYALTWPATAWMAADNPARKE